MNFKKLFLIAALMLCALPVSAQQAFPPVSPMHSMWGQDGKTPANSVGSANNGIPVDKITSGKSTYAATTGFITPYATPTDILVVNGSTTRTVKIVRITLAATQTTAGINNWFLIKRGTSLDTGGATTALTKVPMSSTDAASTAAVLLYTAAPTIGGTTLNVKPTAQLAPAVTSLDQAEWILFDENYTGTPLILNNNTESVAINFAGVAVPAGLSVSFNVTYTEE